MKQNGQIIIVLLLMMLVGLSIGLALTQRSVTDVSTSTQSEQSSRAFSAAEAGLEKALVGAIPGSATITLGNDSSAQVSFSNFLPVTGTNPIPGIEYPPIGRETTAHFWFVNPAAGSINNFYNSSTFDLYYGNAGTTDLPAVEVKVVMYSNGQFYTKNYYYDSSPTRTSGANGNNFVQTILANNGTCTGSPTMATGILGNDRTFYCRQTVPRGYAATIMDQAAPKDVRPCPNSTAPYNCILVLARVRFLYVKENHSLALMPLGGAQLPPQVTIYNSVGTSGQSQKQVQAFRVRDVVLPWFDFAIFSTNEIRK